MDEIRKAIQARQGIVRDNIVNEFAFDIEKGKKMPIGTISNGMKKVAEGEWRKISEQGVKKQSTEKTFNAASARRKIANALGDAKVGRFNSERGMTDIGFHAAEYEGVKQRLTQQFGKPVREDEHRVFFDGGGKEITLNKPPKGMTAKYLHVGFSYM